jgi:hypothetical protein
VEPALFVLAIVVTVAFVAGASRRLGWSPPLVLVVVGVVASFVPGVPTFELDPDLVLIGLLPPLLYAAAIRKPDRLPGGQGRSHPPGGGARAVTTYEVGLTLGGHRQENAFWEHTLRSLATHFGEEAEVDTKVVCVDRRRQWGKAGNIRHNAAIRSTAT